MMTTEPSVKKSEPNWIPPGQTIVSYDMLGDITKKEQHEGCHKITMYTCKIGKERKKKGTCRIRLSYWTTPATTATEPVITVNVHKAQAQVAVDHNCLCSQRRQSTHRRPMNLKPVATKLARKVDYDVVIVGAGVAGCSAAYHLMTTMMTKKKETKDTSSFRVLVVDAGPTPGEGVRPSMRSGSATMTSTAKSETTDTTTTATDNDDDEEIAPCIKMMVQLFAGSCQDFIRHHSTEGAKRYLTATRLGLQYQKQLAREILPWKKGTTDDVQEKRKEYAKRYQELGSYYVGRTERDALELHQEFDILTSLGLAQQQEIEWCDAQRLATVPGLSSDFTCGIYFPKDAIIDSSTYAKQLLAYVRAQCCTKTCTVTFLPNTIVESNVSVSSNNDTNDENSAVQQLVMQHDPTKDDNDDDERKRIVYTANKVVIATGAICPSLQCQQQLQQPLNGLMKPCYSYLVHVPISSRPTSRPTTTIETNNPGSGCSSKKNTKKKYEECYYSSNFFTWGYTHDWCFTKGKIRVSGEDHFSAYKSPQVQQRCNNLSRWILERYSSNSSNNSSNNGNPTTTTTYTDAQVASFPHQYGLYSETVDMVPIIGTVLLAEDDDSENETNITENTVVDDVKDREAKRRKKDNKTQSSNVCYLVGCNAWGQTILSYCATLVPGLLGYAEFTDQQRDILKLVSIRRFTCLPKK